MVLTVPLSHCEFLSAPPRLRVPIFWRSGVRIAVRHIAPLALGIAVLSAWELLVRVYDLPPFVLPAPSAIWMAFVSNFSSLIVSLGVTRRAPWIAFPLGPVSRVT